jgi:hypothetical protein
MEVVNFHFRQSGQHRFSYDYETLSCATYANMDSKAMLILENSTYVVEDERIPLDQEVRRCPGRVVLSTAVRAGSGSVHR